MPLGVREVLMDAAFNFFAGVKITDVLVRP
jgi:hypothetical protein